MSSIPPAGSARDRYAALERCTYLNQASLGLIPAPSIDAMETFLKETAQFGNLYLSDDEEAAILDGVRSAGARVLGTSSDAVAVVAGASEGLGQVTSLLEPAQGTVLLVRSDFPSVTYPWLAAARRRGIRLRFIDDRADRDLTQDLVDAVEPATEVVAFSVVQFATGTRVDAGRVAERAHEVGARIVVDATQLAGAGVVDSTQWGADALVTSGYKWLSAHGGVALLALTPDLVTRLPGFIGWMGALRPFDLDPLTLRLADDARRFELLDDVVHVRHRARVLDRDAFVAGVRAHRRACAAFGDVPRRSGRRAWMASVPAAQRSIGGFPHRVPAPRRTGSGGIRRTSRFGVSDRLRPSSGRAQDLPPRLQRRRGRRSALGGPGEACSPSLHDLRLAAIGAGWVRGRTEGIQSEASTHISSNGAVTCHVVATPGGSENRSPTPRSSVSPPAISIRTDPSRINATSRCSGVHGTGPSTLVKRVSPAHTPSACTSSCISLPGTSGSDSQSSVEAFETNTPGCGSILRPPYGPHVT